jgi:hypothetical protein
MVSPVLGTAATLGLTVGGGYLFGPVGAVAGAPLGNFLFGGRGPDIEGPRLGDLTVGASTYGNAIPVAFATQEIARTIIWAPPIEQQKHTRKIGGGILGGRQKVTEYRYTRASPSPLPKGRPPAWRGCGRARSCSRTSSHRTSPRTWAMARRRCATSVRTAATSSASTAARRISCRTR